MISVLGGCLETHVGARARAWRAPDVAAARQTSQPRAPDATDAYSTRFYLASAVVTSREMSARGDENSNAQRQPASQASIVSFFAAPNAHAKRAREDDDVDAIMMDGGDASEEPAGASGDLGKGKIAKIGTPSGAARDDDVVDDSALKQSMYDTQRTRIGT